MQDCLNAATGDLLNSEPNGPYNTGESIVITILGINIHLCSRILPQLELGSKNFVHT